MEEDIKQKILNVRKELIEMRESILHPKWNFKVGDLIKELDEIVSRVELRVMQKPAGKWISIKDELPSGDLMGEWVLVCYEPMGCGDLIINMAWYDGKWWIDSKTPIEEWEMEYWMPLLKPPATIS